MPRKRKPAQQPDQPAGSEQTPGPDRPKRKQYNVGVSPEVAKEIDETAEALGLDEVNFLRLMIKECLPIYKKRADAIRRGESPNA